MKMSLDEFTKYLRKNFPHRSSFISGFSLFLVDTLILSLCFVIGFFIANFISPSPLNFKSVINYFIFVPFILILYGVTGLYPGIMIPPTEEVQKFTACNFFGFTAILIALIFSDYVDIEEVKKFIIRDSYNRAIALAFFFSFFISIFLMPGVRQFSKILFSRYKWWGVPSIIYCTGNSADEVIDRMIAHKSLGYHPAAIIDSSATKNGEYKGIPVFPPSDDILKRIKAYNIKTAVICSYKGEIREIMYSYRYTISVAPNQSTFTSTQQIKDIAGIIGFSSIHNLTFKFNLLIKRLMDICIIIFFSPIWIPVFIILAIITKLTSKGPVFYCHKRVGKNGKSISCLKFRSMCINSQEILKEILETDPVRRAEWEKDRKFTDDPRITKWGKFLRKTSLDELPQLLNIIAGQMSLTGPRPVTEPELVKYGSYKDYVLSVTPGLSGMWQISGRSDTSYEERIALDSYYIQNWSIWLDIWILIKTVYVVLLGKGAY